VFTIVALRGNTVYLSNRLSNIVKQRVHNKKPFVKFIFDTRKYKVLPSSSELPDTGCKERKLCNIKIKTKMKLKTKMGLFGLSSWMSHSEM